jgi:hypothetical protein
MFALMLAGPCRSLEEIVLIVTASQCLSNAYELVYAANTCLRVEYPTVLAHMLCFAATMTEFASVCFANSWGPR